MNKGKKLRFCKECNKKRFCERERITGHIIYICSKGHRWTIKGNTLENINYALEQVFTKEKFTNLFQRDDLFYRKIK